MTAGARTRNRETLLALIKAAGSNGATTEVLTAKTGLHHRTVVSLCLDLQHGRHIVSGNSGSRRSNGATAIVWRELVPTAPLAARFPFRPLRTPRPTVIPVRAGGRTAPDISVHAHVSFGPFMTNPFRPTKEDFAW